MEKGGKNQNSQMISPVIFYIQRVVKEGHKNMTVVLFLWHVDGLYLIAIK